MCRMCRYLSPTVMTVNGEICSVFLRTYVFNFKLKKIESIMAGILFMIFDQIFSCTLRGIESWGILRTEVWRLKLKLSLSSALRLSFLFVFIVSRYFVTLQSNTDRVWWPLSLLSVDLVTNVELSRRPMEERELFETNEYFVSESETSGGELEVIKYWLERIDEPRIHLGSILLRVQPPSLLIIC